MQLNSTIADSLYFSLSLSSMSVTCIFKVSFCPISMNSLLTPYLSDVSCLYIITEYRILIWRFYYY